MSEYFLIEDDYRSFDRSIGVEAAQSINAIVTDCKLPYSELQNQAKTGEIAPHIGAYLLRAEETAGLHIGRRSENDNLFAGAGIPEIMPAVLEPYSKNVADSLLSDAHHEKRTKHIATLQNSIKDITEPFYTGFLDKVPSTPEKISRWRRDKTPTPITWSEQSPLNPALVHRFNLKPLAAGMGFSEVSCKSTTHESYADGVIATFSTAGTHATRVGLGWELHMDYGDAPATLERLAPGLIAQCDNLGLKERGEWNSIQIDLKEPAFTLNASTFMPSIIDGKSVMYTYDPDLDCFTTNQPDLPPVSTQTYLDLMQQLFNFIPTVRLQ
jgi:hypothetical protein